MDELRRRALQPLRLHRGRLRDDRDSRAPAVGTGDGGHGRRAGRSSGSSTKQAREVPSGATGRIFVGNEMLFEGYTGGGGKEVIEGLMSTGDVGHVDDAGHLFVDGRDDEMIVSGGENVFPREVEDLLLRHAAVDEAAVIGVPDSDFGQRLKAFVVTTPGKKLTEDDVKAYVKKNLARLQGPARGRVHG